MPMLNITRRQCVLKANLKTKQKNHFLNEKYVTSVLIKLYLLRGNASIFNRTSRHLKEILATSILDILKLRSMGYR